MFYAKSQPLETIREHTDELLIRLEQFKNIYGKRIIEKQKMSENEFWKILELACEYHDYGKVYTPFQNIILQSIGEKKLPTEFNYSYIKHEQLSPMFVPEEDVDLDREKFKLLVQVIYYHHEREGIDLKSNIVKEIINKDIVPRYETIKKELKKSINLNMDTYYLKFVSGRERITIQNNLYIEYCLIKGLLHRLDHSASAHLDIEENTNEILTKYVQKFMNNNEYKLNDLQIYCLENKEENLILIGSTGMGKTEAALYWIDNGKAFFTLPIRISINAIFNRISNLIAYKHVGLLHSTALEYLEEKKIENAYIKYEDSKMLSPKIITCTIDQIFPFVFKYKGYEKIYATMSYSKVIIDEIQAYSPEIVAVILKGLEMIHKIGGKFLIMTATLPRIYKEELEKLGIDFKYNKFIKDLKRHRIKIRNNNVIDDLNEIKERGKNGKVLIIVNTVNKAIELYQQFKKNNINNVKLLHSRFVLEHRSNLENEIKEFSNNKDLKGIWITTQIVEASLDIDFDYLYTEMSTLDSFFQRLGRCYRTREYYGDVPNVYAYINDCSAVPQIYDKEIYQKSIEFLNEFNGEILEEQTKIDLVDKLYSKENLEGTEFYSKFRQGMDILNNLTDYEIDKKKAQELLRNIDNVMVISRSMYEKNLELIDEFKNTKNSSRKWKIKKHIEQLTVSISRGQFKKYKDYIFSIDINDIYGIDLKYSIDMGLILQYDEEYDLDSRFIDE